MPALFDIPKRATKNQDAVLAKKSKVKTKTSSAVARGNGVLGRISEIKAMVETKLGKFKDDYIIISDIEILHSYIAKVLENGIISIDTETTGLDPLQNEIVGICIYTPGEKAAYIPLNHKSYVTGAKANNQLDMIYVKEAFQEISAHKSMVDVIMFNACFDIRFLRNQLGWKDAYCTWDCYLASRLMNENEEHKGLKALHRKYCLNGEGDAFSFDALFNGITFDKIPINVGYLYAAHDAIITYELYKFQLPYLDTSFDLCKEYELENVAWVFHNIEMPCVQVVADMEDTGVDFDLDYCSKLSEKYSKLLQEKIDRFNNLCNMNKDLIDAYRLKNPNNKLENPINIASPTQIAILLYDILGAKVIDKVHSRGTGEDILLKMDNDFAKVILEYREVAKLISTYIDKMPECINPNDGRIHCKFNQYGADTGRFSSQDPNLQNIPSHNKDIRKMFKATDGYVLMSSDYSQQEPKVMTQMCGDPKMIEAYQKGKDLYAEIAALSFSTTYDNCLEFRPDGTTNPEGKNRRSQAKSILLGVLYGRGVPSIAEQLGTTTKKAQAIKDSVFDGFPAIPQFEKDSLKMAKEKGFVTTLWGRKRRLPDLQLPEYEFKWKEGYPKDEDPLDFDNLSFDDETGMPLPIEAPEVPDDLIKKYLRKLSQARFGAKRKVFEQANEEGIWIVDNGGKIADAQRQCVNARIQGSAADMSKLAMIKVGTNERLKELGFRLLIPVHDELIAECPEENAKEAAELFAKLMSEAAESKLEIPISCDVEITRCWYGETIDGEKLKKKETQSIKRTFDDLNGHGSGNWHTDAERRRTNERRKKD